MIIAMMATKFKIKSFYCNNQQVLIVFFSSIGFLMSKYGYQIYTMEQYEICQKTVITINRKSRTHDI